MRIINNQEGFSHIVIVLVVVILGVIGFAGYRVMNMNKTDKVAQPVTNSAAQETAISNEDDLNDAVDSLNSVDTSTKEDEDSLSNL